MGAEQAQEVGLARELADWAAGLEAGAIPDRVLSYAKSQLVSHLANVRAGMAHPLGEKLVRALGPPLQDDPARASRSLAALSMCVELDEGVYAGHVSHSTVNVALSYARALGRDGRSLLAAIVAANECAARVSAAVTLGPLPGQSNAPTHLVGAVAARLAIEGAPPERWVDALGIALAQPPRPLFPAFVGSDAKVLTAAAAVDTALLACDVAAAGLRGAPDLLEHPEGFIAQFASVPLPETVTAGLGERWHTETMSFKLVPTSTSFCAAVECAARLAGELPPGSGPDEIEEVVVTASIFSLESHYRAAPHLAGADSPVSALNWTAGYAVATALLTGGLVPGDLARPALEDEARWALAEKVRLEHDWDVTDRAALGTAPIGEAIRQAGERALDWMRSVGVPDPEWRLEHFGPPSETFEAAEKTMGSRIVVRLRDGRELRAECVIPPGFAGPDTRARHPELVRRKLEAAGGPGEAADLVRSLEAATAADVARAVELALA
jgi:2-methylcitrate dehydratase PrpD